MRARRGKRTARPLCIDLWSGLTALIVLLCAQPAWATEVQFGTQQEISTDATGAHSVFAADVDGDGDLDTLSASAFDNKIAWYENTAGDGSVWSAQQVISTATDWASSVFAADVDGDGDLDVLSASRLDNKIAWYENTAGDGSVWSAQQVISTDALAAQSVFAEDVDGDGDMDVLSASANDDKIAWYENTAGDGSVWSAEQVISTAANGAWSVFAADVDGDGDLDTLSALANDSKITWYENMAGDGSVWSTEQVISTAANGPFSVFAADVDGDGDLDALSASIGDNKIAWHENETIHRNAVYPEQSVITTLADQAEFVYAADIDADGNLDVLSASYADDKIAWYANSAGDGSVFSPQQVITTAANGAKSVVAADVDGDGDIDALSASYVDANISWYENDGSPGGLGDWTKRDLDIDAKGATSVFAADVDGDGDIDALAAAANDDTVAWYENDGASPPTWTYREVSSSATGASAVFASDIDGDGDMDILSASPGTLAWYENDGASPPGWTARTITSASYGNPVIYADDIDGDGDTDVLWAAHWFGPGDRPTLRWYENDGSSPPVWTPWNISLFAHTVRLQSILVIDADNDGDRDVLTASDAASPQKLMLHESDGASPPAWTNLSIDAFAMTPQAIFAGDMDGDGDQDILTASSADDKISLFRNGGGQFTLGTTDEAPAALESGIGAMFFEIEASHNGRAGDEDLELATFDFLFEESPGDPLTTAEANDLIALIRIYLFEGDFYEVTTVLTLSLDQGVQTVDLSAAPSMVQIAQGETRYYKLWIHLTPDAELQSPRTFQVTHLTDATSTAVHSGTTVPLSLQQQSNVSSTPLTAGGLYVTGVLPAADAVNVPLETNVYVIFSEAVNPATITTSTFRLLDGGGSPVSADISIAPLNLQATLDPWGALSDNTTYTVEVTAGVQDQGGAAAVPFTSRFHTDATEGGEIPLPSVSEEAAGIMQQPPTKASGDGEWTPENTGWAVSPAGDINSDGYDDFIAGAPGHPELAALTNVCRQGNTNECMPCGGDNDCDDVVDACVTSGTVACTMAEVGAALLYFGGDTDVRRESADIVFVGHDRHDRAGVSVAGDFDFSGDGVPDLLIGAEQWNRSGADDLAAECNDDEGCGPGKVYLIYFDPSDYPNIADPDVVDWVNLEDVADVIFHGTNTGDQAGYALAAGGALGWDVDSSDVIDDIVIGAPGASSGAGEAYVIFSDGTLTSNENLSDVGGSVSGRIYQGLFIERVGTAVALPGNITGTAGDDIALGAPHAPTSAGSSAGKVFVVEGGELRSGAAINVSSIDAQVHGSQAFEELGSALSGGGDNRRDGYIDLLIGCPLYDVDSNADAGRVVHISDQLPASEISADDVGGVHIGALDGVIWEGASGDDQLGHALANIGDVTGNNWNDIALAAPYSSPNSLAEAGTVYLIEGETESTGIGGPMPVSLVGASVAGLRLTGGEAGEHAGFSIGAAGDLNLDGKKDFIAGAPGKDSGQGTVYMVLDSQPDQPGTCDADGCVIADLATGAELVVHPNYLEVSAILAVGGILDEAGLAAQGISVPAGYLLAGAADYDDENQGFPGGDPDAHIPIQAEMEDQISDIGFNEEVFYYDTADGWFSLGTIGTVATNPYYASNKAVALNIDPLHVYAVFLEDQDRDGRRDDLDCEPELADHFETPHEIMNLRMSSLTTLEWDSDAVNSGSGTMYEVLRGPLDDLPVVLGSSGNCIGTAGTETTREDTTEPLSTQGYYYLVRGASTANCGYGSYGARSTTEERLSAGCP